MVFSRGVPAPPCEKFARGTRSAQEAERLPALNTPPCDRKGAPERRARGWGVFCPGLQNATRGYA